MSFVTLAVGAAEAVKAFLSGEGLGGPVRIELRFVGCCDPSLGLALDTVRETDLVQETEGLTFVISPETYTLAGDVTISCGDDGERSGFVLVSSRPVSEWEGFAVCYLRKREEDQGEAPPSS